jgi:ribosome-binding factor A
MSAGRRGGRRGAAAPTRRYPRVVRVNEILREILAEELERLVDTDDRLGLLTITAVDSDADLGRATVLFASLSDEAREALADARIRLQAAIGRQVSFKRTPLLAFEADPAIAGGQRVEDILRNLKDNDES